MKKIIIYLVLFIGIFTNAQFYYPLINEIEKSVDKTHKYETFHEIIQRNEQYFKNKDTNKKGSGYKQFKRWENQWKRSLNSDGTIITANQIKEIWEKRDEQLKASKYKVVNITSDWKQVDQLFPYTEKTKGTGRINVICIDPSNPNTIYVGAPNGGIWKSTNGGANWKPLSDYLPVIGVSGIAVDYKNSNIIYIATGDKISAISYSLGVYKSIDGGITWKQTGLTFNSRYNFCGDLIMHPSNSQILFCNTNEGLKKTSDGGNTWITVINGNFSIGSLRFKPKSPNIVYAVSDNKAYRSTNTGDTFTEMNIPFTSTQSIRINLDVTEADPNYLYIARASDYDSFDAIYKSTDSGITWTKKATTANMVGFSNVRFGYNMSLSLSQINRDIIYLGNVEIVKSVDGGSNFTSVASWSDYDNPAYTHADTHYLKGYGNKMYCCSDGGIYVSEDEGKTFKDLSKELYIGQIYSLSVSKLNPKKLVVGLQDAGGDIMNLGKRIDFSGGDGTSTAIDPNDDNIMYTNFQGGAGLNVTTDGGLTGKYYINSPTNVQGSWETPHEINSKGELYAGFDKIYKLDLKNQKWLEHSKSDLGGSSINVIAIDPLDDNIMYLTIQTRLYKSVDKGLTFNKIFDSTNNIQSICINKNNSNIVYMTFDGNEAEVVKSIDGGKTFSSFNNGLPKISKNVVAHYPNHPLNALFVGTQFGVYYRDDSMSLWEPFVTNLPNVSITDLDINNEENVITAATFGRGIWQTKLPVSLYNKDIKLVNVISPQKGITCNSLAPKLTVKNIGLSAINSIDFSFIYNGITKNQTWNGTVLPNETKIIQLNSVNIPNGKYTLEVIANTTDDTNKSNNKRVINFDISETGLIGKVKTFETTNDNMLLSNFSTFSTNQWSKGVRTSGGLTTGSNVYTTNLLGNYNKNEFMCLNSPCYDLTNVSNSILRFKMAYKTELNFDVIYVEYSTDNGNAWSLLGNKTASWYTNEKIANCNYCPSYFWSGTSTTMKEYFYPLNFITAKSNVIFRIVFQSDENDFSEGVVVDDFVVEGTLSNQEYELDDISIYPNPTDGIFNISAGENSIDAVEIYDFTGKKVYNKSTNNNANKINSVDISSFSKGVYLLRVISKDLVKTSQLIKN